MSGSEPHQIHPPMDWSKYESPDDSDLSEQDRCAAMWNRWRADMASQTMSGFTCPFCQATSHHPADAAQRYCGRCHVWVDDVMHASPVVRKAMGRFCRRMAEINPDTAEVMLRRAVIWETAPNDP